MHSIILSYIISKYTINQIKSSNIIRWLRVIQCERKRERVRITKKKETDWESERKTVRKKEEESKKKKIKTLEERKKEDITLSEIHI